MEPAPNPAEAATESKASLVSRLMNIIVAPGEVFDAVKTVPVSAANWLMPAILFIVLSWASAGVIFSQDSIRQQLSDIRDKAIDRQVAAGRMSQDQAERGRQVGEKWAGLTYEVGAVVGPTVMGFAVPFWWGLLLWLAGTKALRGGFSYMKAVEVAGMANMILVLDVVIRTLLILLKNDLFASPSLALLVKDFDPQDTAHALLALANVMMLWLLVVRSVGLSRLSGASFAKAAAWVFGMWAAWTAVLFGLGAAMQALGKALTGG
jgi:hypothetical protein